ncbi:hypothetical protein D9M70_554910 [compost metagenome]
MGVFLEEGIHQLADALPAQVGGAGHPDGAAQLRVATAYGAVQRFHVFEDLLCRLEQKEPLGGRAETPGVPLDQAYPVELFHRLEPTAHGGGRET